MNNKVLSEDEIDALADSVSRGEIAVGTDSAPLGEVHVYNFLQPEHILKARFPVLDIINEQFSKGLQAGLFSQLDKRIEISASEASLIKYGDYVNSMPEAPSISRVHVKPLNGDLFFNIDITFIFVIIEAFFGGIGEFHDSNTNKEFTNVEKRIIQRLLKLIFAHLKKAWDMILDLDFEFVQLEENHQIPNLLDASDIIVVSKFICTLSKQKESWLHICMPYSLMEPVKSLLSFGSKYETVESSKEWFEALLERVKDIQLDIRTVVGNSDISLKDLLSAEEGDFIAMDMKEDLVTYSGNIPVFSAKMGVSNGYAAVRFLNWLYK